MITNEAEIRIAVQAVLAGVLAFYGFWGCALVVLVMLLPWKPILAAGGYLAQPLVDWRIRKGRDQNERSIIQIDQELDDLFCAPRGSAHASWQVSDADVAAPRKPCISTSPQPVEIVRPDLAMKPVVQDAAGTAWNPSAALVISPAIKEHVRNLPQNVLGNMDFEVEDVALHGETAEAYVRFQSANVTELVIRKRYVLRKSGDLWRVESGQPREGKPAIQIPPPRRLPVQTV